MRAQLRGLVQPFTDGVDFVNAALGVGLVGFVDLIEQERGIAGKGKSVINILIL